MEQKIYKIDATGEALGRVAAKAAMLLRGKNQPAFLRHIDYGQIVEIENINKIKFSGRKLKQKKYFHHSGYMGGLKMESLEDKIEKNPEAVVRKAVLGMLPKNRTRNKIIKRLKIYKENKI